MIHRLITRIACRISRESVSLTEAEVYSAYAITITVEAGFEQICCLLARVSRDQQRVVALHGVLSEYLGVTSGVDWLDRTEGLRTGPDRTNL